MSSRDMGSLARKASAVALHKGYYGGAISLGEACAKPKKKGGHRSWYANRRDWQTVKVGNYIGKLQPSIRLVTFPDGRYALAPGVRPRFCSWFGSWRWLDLMQELGLQRGDWDE